MKTICWTILIIYCNTFCYIHCFLFYSTGLSDTRSPNYSYSDSWISEELWPKEKSIIHIQLVRPSPKQMPVWELRDKDNYLLDPSLDFDSPDYSQNCNNCLIEYKSLTNDGLIQVQISGNECSTLPMSSLKYNSNITHLIIRDTAIVNLTKFGFGAAKLDKLKRIDIIDNRLLVSIESRAFDGVSQLAYLSLINNHLINRVSVECFVGLKSLEELIWVSNGRIDSHTLFTLLQSSSVRILPTLIHLHISGVSHHHYDSHKSLNSSLPSGIKLNKDDFSNLSHLKYLQLTNCDIRFIHSLSFVPLKNNLKRLNLSGNRALNISSLKQAILNAFQTSVIDKLDLSETISTKSIPKELMQIIGKLKITDLYLNHMKLNQIIFGDIPPMPYLKSLYIEYSQLEYIEDNSLQQLDELISLSLKGNYLRTISPNFVSNLPKLQYLDLSGYKYNRTQFEIPPKTFIGNILKEVSLSYKLLDPLPRNAFLGLFKMQRFHLRGCGLKFVEYLTFFPLKSATYIDLSENEELIKTLRDTHEDSFFGLEAIEMVRMSHCNLTSRDINDDQSIFKRIHEHVTLLDLSHNKIDRIGDKTFNNFSELLHLDLSHNLITSWSNFSIFSMNKYITTLDISSNRLSRLTSSMLEDFHRLKNLSFAMNPIKCDCKSQIVSDWINDTTNIHYIKNRHPLRSKSQYYCALNGEHIIFKNFIEYCKNNGLESTRVSLPQLLIIVIIIFVPALGILFIAIRYELTLLSCIHPCNGIEDDVVYQYDAFVSYNVNDSDWVFKQLVPNIENNDSDFKRIKLCVYDRDFIAGRPISECILESIKTSRKVILVLSNNFMRSPWCRFETDLAHNTLTDQNRDGLIVIKLEELEKDSMAYPHIYYLLKNLIYLQWIDTNVKEQEIFWKKLRRALRFKCLKNQYFYYEDKAKEPSVVMTSVSINSQNSNKTTKMSNESIILHEKLKYNQPIVITTETN